MYQILYNGEFQYTEMGENSLSNILNNALSHCQQKFGKKFECELIQIIPEKIEPKEFRQKLGLTQKKFGELIGYGSSQVRISELERNKRGISPILQRLLEALNFINSEKLMEKFKNFLESKHAL